MRTHRFLPITILASLGFCAGAQPLDLPELPGIDVINHTLPDVYRDQAVVRVYTTSQAQLDALLGLVESVWSERAGVGRLDVQIRREHLDDLTKLGIVYDTLIADLQAQNQSRWARVQRLERQWQARPQHQRGAGAHDESWFSNYRQLSDIIAYVNDVAAQRPDLATMGVAGQSLQGNDIYTITISAPDAPGNARADRPVVLWQGAQHAREWVSPMTVSYLASRFVDDYDNDPRVRAILGSVRLVIVPVSNPDGYLYTWSNERYWRKNRRNNGGGTFGVDLNRNWGYEWGGEGASPFPDDDTYRGASPFSEPETQIVRDLARSFGDNLAGHIDYHTYSQLILWPFGYAAGVQTPEPDRTFFDELSTAMSDEILAFSGVFYDPIQSVDLYPAAGDSSDWFYGELDVPSLTIELRPDASDFDGFNPPPETILPTARENFEAAKLFVERTTQPLTFRVEPVELVEAGLPTPIEITVSDVLDTHNPSTVTLHTRIGDSDVVEATPMTPLGENRYQGLLPGAGCGAVIHYAFSADTTNGLTLSFPSAGELDALAQEFTTSFEDDMQTDTGWTAGIAGDSATTGVWERADPQGTAAQPEDDHSPDGTLCWVTGASAGSGIGANDIDGGATTLVSPILDAIALGDETQLVYWRWYSNNQGAAPNTDTMTVQISNDIGNSWTTLEVVGDNAQAWVQKRFRIADYVEPTDMIRVRFIASDFGDGSIVEAGVDDVRIERIGCDANRADLNGDGVLNFFDVSLFLSAFNSQDPIADFTDDGEFNFFDVSAFLAAFAAG